ncbi:hypothetical protein [Streptomyces mirabilis]|uniref:hypothetical protein n=1 Tax=Streptomyces mirabilis TaxID=68239 RepID=UPI0036AF2020
MVTNAVSQQSHWPSWLGWLQAHPWLWFVILGVVTAGLTALLAALDDHRTPVQSPEPAVRPDDGSGPPGAALVLRSLPRDTAAFTDRSAELESLVRSVRAAQETGEALLVHVIDGMPGVGKTTFAVHAGHVLSERFPDGQLFVNLNGHTTGRSPVQATEALASLLAATGVPTQQIPVGDDVGAITEARAAIWRSRLAGKKALLILDNAASYRQLEPLLPGGSDCLVLVTSRKRLAAHEEVVLPVEALPSDHAVDLFIRLSGRTADSLTTMPRLAPRLRRSPSTARWCRNRAASNDTPNGRYPQSRTRSSTTSRSATARSPARSSPSRSRAATNRPCRSSALQDGARGTAQVHHRAELRLPADRTVHPCGASPVRASSWDGAGTSTASDGHGARPDRAGVVRRSVYSAIANLVKSREWLGPCRPPTPSHPRRRPRHVI